MAQLQGNRDNFLLIIVQSNHHLKKKRWVQALMDQLNLQDTGNTAARVGKQIGELALLSIGNTTMNCSTFAKFGDGRDLHVQKHFK
ncbi:hypothetical protein ACQJBY_063032 [Aegilops geniculata]